MARNISKWREGTRRTILLCHGQLMAHGLLCIESLRFCKRQSVNK
jgi:hypothetical protein